MPENNRQNGEEPSLRRSIEVHKYGGSSVATTESINRIAERLARSAQAGKRLVVVVSAMGKTTNGLLDLARDVNQSPDNREMDMLLSAGERISAAVMAMSLRGHGVPAVSLSGEQAGVHTDGNHGSAKITDVDPRRILREIEGGKVVVVAGFQGTDGQEVTTLGRGGSDTTAVALAAAMGARCDIFSDVDGVYSADPRVVDSARRLDEVAYDEMHTLARFGARVLNADAVSMARKHNVPVYARSTFGSPKWTEIGPQVSGRNTACGVAGVTGSDKVVRIRVPTAGGFVEEVRGELEVVAHLSDNARAEALVSTSNVPCVDSLEERIAKQWPGAKVCRDLGSVAVVGDNLGSHEAARQTALRALAKNGVKPAGSYADKHSFACLVPRKVVDNCVRTLHRVFIDAPAVTAAPA